MELIWIRLYTPYIGPVVYSFGMILVAYLSAAFVLALTDDRPINEYFQLRTRFGGLMAKE
jgi:hypothetical protein